ncbi:MAG: hypothetical protein ABEJ92_09230 [Halobacteriales archaeon]
MSTEADDLDALAHALVDAEYDFDAVERGSLRAEWSADDTGVVVVDTETGEEIVYSADDLVLATSDREIRNARAPESG